MTLPSLYNIKNTYGIFYRKYYFFIPPVRRRFADQYNPSTSDDRVSRSSGSYWPDERGTQSSGQYAVRDRETGGERGNSVAKRLLTGYKVREVTTHDDCSTRRFQHIHLGIYIPT